MARILSIEYTTTAKPITYSVGDFVSYTPLPDVVHMCRVEQFVIERGHWEIVGTQLYTRQDITTISTHSIPLTRLIQDENLPPQQECFPSKVAVNVSLLSLISCVQVYDVHTYINKGIQFMQDKNIFYWTHYLDTPTSPLSKALYTPDPTPLGTILSSPMPKSIQEQEHYTQTLT